MFLLFKILLIMSKQEYFEELLAHHCAPTLCKCKVANMFHLEKSKFEDIDETIKTYNQILKTKNIYIHIFQSLNSRVTIFVFSKKQLESLLNRDEVKHFLSLYGYKKFSIHSVFNHLKKRLNESIEYPHEIGVLLGYPLEDVIGFIESQSCIMIGTWKVYNSNPDEAQQRFKLYKSVREYFIKEVRNGRKIATLVH